MKHNYQVDLSANFQQEAQDPQEIRQCLFKLIKDARFNRVNFDLQIIRVEKEEKIKGVVVENKKVEKSITKKRLPKKKAKSTKKKVKGGKNGKSEKVNG